MQDNNIEFWREFVTEYFAPNAKKRWCVSLYGSGRQTTGVFPQVYLPTEGEHVIGSLCPDPYNYCH